MTVRLMRLYNLANEAEEREACLNYWLLLPVDEKLKRETLDKIRIAEGIK